MHLGEKSYEKPFQFIENQWIKAGVWALFPLRTASRTSGEQFSSYFSPILPLFSIVEMPKGWSWMILEHSGSMGKKPISKMNAHKCEQSVRPVDEVSGRVIGYKKKNQYHH